MVNKVKLFHLLFICISTVSPLTLSIFVVRDNPEASLIVILFACSPFFILSYLGYRLSKKLVLLYCQERHP